jgi:predicted hotdog family 3-hydroxylacyl-ACP dehydratase
MSRESAGRAGRSGGAPLEELVPHSGAMLLVGPVLEHCPEFTRCRVDVSRSALFAGAGGRVPAWLALEWMAQCVAAHGGLVARALGLPARPGLFLGTRGVRLQADDFGPGDDLEVCARHLRGELGLVSFACRLDRPGGREALAEGNLNVYVVERIEDLLPLAGE